MNIIHYYCLVCVHNLSSKPDFNRQGVSVPNYGGDADGKKGAAEYLLIKKSHLALVYVLVALVEVILDAVPIVDLDVVADLRDRRPDGFKRSILCRLHHTYLLLQKRRSARQD